MAICGTNSSCVPGTTCTHAVADEREPPVVERRGTALRRRAEHQRAILPERKRAGRNRTTPEAEAGRGRRHVLDLRLRTQDVHAQALDERLGERGRQQEQEPVRIPCQGERVEEAPLRRAPAVPLRRTHGERLHVVGELVVQEFGGVVTRNAQQRVGGSQVADEGRGLRSPDGNEGEGGMHSSIAVTLSPTTLPGVWSSHRVVRAGRSPG